jgi:hypothetical protein
MRCLTCLFVVAMACGTGAGAGPGIDSGMCPATVPSGGTCTGGLSCTYPEQGPRQMVCTCDEGGWSCTDCQSGACSPGETCSATNWQHQCQCQCDSHGNWSCVGPDGTPDCLIDTSYQDAGVDAPGD